MFRMGVRLAAMMAASMFVATAFAQTTIQEFPKIADMYRMLDPANPYRTVVSGLFRQTVKVGDAERSFLVYIAKDNAQYQPYLFVVPDARQDPVAVLEKGGWKKIADERGMIVIVAQTPDRRWTAERDLEYLNKVYAIRHER